MTVFKLIVGLGNPGAEYAKTRHNAGFWFVEGLTHSALMLNTKFKSLVSCEEIGRSKTYLVLPQTYMNRSGEAVIAIAQFYKILPSEILVVHDELDLPPGSVRLKKGGGHGGHNGLKSIISQLGTNEFTRLRIGIGHPGHASDVADYVLKKAPSDEHIAIEHAIVRALSFKNEIVAGKLDQVMNQLHQV